MEKERGRNERNSAFRFSDLFATRDDAISRRRSFGCADGSQTGRPEQLEVGEIPIHERNFRERRPFTPAERKESGHFNCENHKYHISYFKVFKIFSIKMGISINF